MKKQACMKILDVDREFYETRLKRFLPDRIVDIHTHVWRKKDFPAEQERDTRVVSWPSRVASENPVEDLEETYRLMLPGKQVIPLMFATLPAGNNLDRQNRYVAACSRKTAAPALIFSDPAWSAEELEGRVKAGGFLGAKSYLTLVPGYIPSKEIRIFDYFPPHQLEVHDRNGWLVMLHIPRDGRLRDPVNLQQLLEIERAYPKLQLIVAHVGRAYRDEDVGDAFDVLSGTRRMVFDFSANTNERVFARLIKAVGPNRILFGTDLPITRMRMRRVIDGDHYVNLVPKGLYGDVSGDRNMREVTGGEAKRLSFFMYEELDAFRRAAIQTKLSSAQIRLVFHGNSVRMLAKARRGKA